MPNRLPPNSVEAEMHLLGSMLLVLTRAQLAEILAIVRSADLFQEDHRLIFDAIVEIYQRGLPVDAMVVRENLMRRGFLEEVGGVEYLAAILNSVPDASDAVKLARAVRDWADRRRLER
ncbi:MAG TPA: DnaB-like helicase N-terminal domain-containing protein [Tepidisphaeraceae bacterium]|nr:DnaB-like helicase N-terminal domain-containing protein [Tepidisphaeraceae bacterium]